MSIASGSGEQDKLLTRLDADDEDGTEAEEPAKRRITWGPRI